MAGVKNLSIRACLLLSLTCACCTGAQATEVEQASVCETLDTCVAELMAAAQNHRQGSETLRARLVAFDSTAVDALVPLLSHPDPSIQDAAGITLSQFRRIDPKHLPVLVRAWREGDIGNVGRGNGWMPRAIAATATNEAVQLLWDDFLRDPDWGSNSQVFFALGHDLGERIRPLIVRQLEQCAETNGEKACDGIYSLLREFKPPFPAWSIEAIARLATEARPEKVRTAAEYQLGRLKHPIGLAAFQRWLRDYDSSAALSAEASDEVEGVIADIARFGSQARASAPAIARFLDPRFGEDLRTTSALALGQLGDPSTIAALLAISGDLDDDWLLAYNVAESLGRLRASAARPLLQRLVREHWHKGVRNNAARALNAIAGGPFARPDIRGDEKPYAKDASGEAVLYLGGLRYQGDDASSGCVDSSDLKAVRVSASPIGSVNWTVGSAKLVVSQLDAEARRRLDGRSAPLMRSLVGMLPVRGGVLGAFNAGEFGGGLFYLPDAGKPRVLINEPVQSAWRMGRQLFVAAGLAHLILDRGHFYIVDPKDLKVQRVIRLPASPRSIQISKHRAIIINTAEGDVVLLRDGRLVDPDRLDSCADDETRK